MDTHRFAFTVRSLDGGFGFALARPLPYYVKTVGVRDGLTTYLAGAMSVDVQEREEEDVR